MKYTRLVVLGKEGGMEGLPDPVWRKRGAAERHGGHDIEKKSGFLTKAKCSSQRTVQFLINNFIP